MSSFSIDEQWYERLAKLASVQDYEYFVGNDLYRQKQKRDFLADKIRNPRLDYPQIEIEKIRERIKGLEELQVAIETEEKNEFVARAYQDKIEEKLTEQTMALATKMMTKSKNDEQIKKYANQFKKCTESLYGEPTPGIFNFALKLFREKIVKNINHHNFIIGQASEDLLKVLPMPDERYIKNYVFWQNKRNLNRVKRILMEEIRVLFEVTDKDIQYQPEEIKQFFERKIRELGFDNWGVEIDNNYQSVSVDQNQKKIYVPRTRKIDPVSLEKLVLHEIGVHVLRRENGERSKLKLLGLGLDHCEIGEEGLASLVEGLFRDQIAFTFFSLLSYVAIGLVYGSDGSKRDFRDIFTILTKLYLYIGLVNWPDKDIEETKNKAIANAFNRCVRIFRGTNCQLAGVCFTRDLIYLKGKICMWDVINHKPEELKRVYCGKYNPGNDRHTQLLDDLGIN